MTETVEMQATDQEQFTPRRVEWALVPRVNLLPVEIVEARHFRRVQFLLMGAVVAAIAAAVGATVWAQQGVDDARTDLGAVEAEVAALQQEQAEFAEAPKVIAQVEAATAARQQVMTRDVLWYRYLGEVASALPSGVLLDSFTVALSDTPVSAGTAVPLTSTGIGTISVKGTSTRYGGVSAWMEALHGLPGTTAATLSTAARDSATAADLDAEPPVTFSSGATITEKALSRRYERKAG